MTRRVGDGVGIFREDSKGGGSLEIFRNDSKGGGGCRKIKKKTRSAEEGVVRFRED